MLVISTANGILLGLLGSTEVSLKLPMGIRTPHPFSFLVVVESLYLIVVKVYIHSIRVPERVRSRPGFLPGAV